MVIMLLMQVLILFYICNIFLDDDSVGWKQERPNLGEGEFPSAIYNPHSTVSIETQRQRLPIFKVTTNTFQTLLTLVVPKEDPYFCVKAQSDNAIPLSGCSV